MTTIDRPRGPLVTTYDRDTCTRVIVIGPDAAPSAPRAAPEADVEPANANAAPATDPPPADGEPPTSVAVLPGTVRRPVAPFATETAEPTGLPPEAPPDGVLRTADDTAFVAEDVVFATDETAPDAAFVTVVTTGGVGGAGGGLGGGWTGGGGELIGTVVGTVGTGTGVVTVGTGVDVVGSGNVGSPSASAPPATAPPPSNTSAVTAAAAFTRM